MISRYVSTILSLPLFTVSEAIASGFSLFDLTDLVIFPGFDHLDGCFFEFRLLSVVLSFVRLYQAGYVAGHDVKLRPALRRRD